MDDCALRGASMHFTRAADALCAIAHDSEAHPVAIGFAVEAFPVVLNCQHHVLGTERKLDDHLASSTVLDSVTHCLLRDAVKLSRYRRANRRRSAVGFPH